MATILTKKKDTSGAPSAGDLTNDTGGAELAVNTADKRLYTKDSGGNVVEVGINPTSITTGTLNTSGAVVFNDAGADVDFRVEGDTDANLLFVDAGADKVGIGTGSPTGGKLVIPQSNAIQPAIYLPTDESTIQGPNADTQIRMGGNLVVQSGNVTAIQAKNAAGYIAFGTGSTPTERMRIDSSGNVLVGATSNAIGSRVFIEGGSTSEALGLKINSSNSLRALTLWNQATTGQRMILFLTGASAVTAGSIECASTTTSYLTSSDYRLKENVAPMTGALAKVLELKPVTYTWKEDGSAGQGFIAHELQAICPDAVSGEKDATEIQRVEVSPAVPATYDEEGNELTPAVEAVYEEREVPAYQGVDTSFLVATLTAAIQELKAELDAAKERIAALENA